jgi:serine/threonine protein kinase/formylglycine-generating enzyme required for sulfatase activity
MRRHSSFELFEELGRSDHTIVYRGYDINLGRDVAIKELSDSCREDDRQIEQLLREAQFLAQFEHESVLSVYSVEREQGWIVMELMQGTLAALIADGSSNPDLVRSVMRQVLGALDFLHTKNKIHGTVRPNNLLINEHGRVKLSEFEQADPKGEMRAPTGSKKYLAPELIRPEFGEFGPALDLYCLGFTALELLTGARFDSFFPGTGDGAIDADIAWMRWHRCEENLPPVATLAKNVPDDLAYVIDRMLKKDVDQRPQSAVEVLNDLDDRPIVLVPVPEANSERRSSSPMATKVREVAPPPIQQPEAVPADREPPAPPVRKKQRRKSNALKPWTTAWFNDRLGKPYILYPLCATIIVGAIAIGLGSGQETSGRETTDANRAEDGNVVEVADSTRQEVEVAFEIASNSQEALAGELIVLQDGAAIEPNENGRYPFVPGQYALQFKMKGFDDLQQDVEIEEDTSAIPIQLSRSATRVRVFVSVFPNAAMVRVNTQPQPGSDGLLTIDQWDDQPLKLSASSEGFDDYQVTMSPQQLANADYRVQIKLSRTPQTLPRSLVKAAGAPIDDATGYPTRVRLRNLEGVAPMELALVQPGEYKIGVHGEAKFAWESEGRTTTIEQPFYIAIHETTNRQYGAFHIEAGEATSGNSWLKTAQKYARLNGERSTENDLPVSNVSLAQVEAFCRWAGGALPSEAQWESAARGLDDHGYPHPWLGGQVADENRCHLFRGGEPQPIHVDKMTDGRSATGLMHLLGNVSEWCRDSYDAEYGSESRFVAKGCSFATARLAHVRVTWRRAANPQGEWDLGFRMVVLLDAHPESAGSVRVQEALASWNR